MYLPHETDHLARLVGSPCAVIIRLRNAARAIVLACMASAPVSAWAAGGFLYDASGSVSVAVGKSAPKSATKDGEIAAGSVVRTGEKSHAVLKFDDGQVVIMKANSTLQIREYHYDPKHANENKIVFSMFKGGMRFITGEIGKLNPKGFRLATPHATIRIYGTDFMVVMAHDVTYTQVLAGSVSISLTNAAGMTVVSEGQTAFTPSATTLTRLLPAGSLSAGIFSQVAAIPVARPSPAPAALAVSAPQPARLSTTQPVPAQQAASAVPENIQSGSTTGVDRVLPLEVVINGEKSGTWLLVERAGVLYAQRDAFEEWRVQVSPDAKPIIFKGQEYLPLSAVPGFKAKMDYANQSVELLFSPQAFAATRLAQEGSKRPVVGPVLPTLFLNYDLNYQTSALRDAPTVRDLGLLSEIGVSNSLGVLTSSQAGRNLTNDTTLGTERSWVRLETTFTRDFPGENRTLRLGDTTTRAGMWGRNVYFGGIQYGTNFGLTPGFITQPIPVLSGLSAAPSTVEMYVNDVLRQVSNVPTGPFVVDSSPVMTGSGNVRMVVRDILGRETVIEQAFFTTTQLLAYGLNDWSIETGEVRRDMGIASNHYGSGFVSGTWRHGYSNTLTLESRAEALSQLQTLGIGAASALPSQTLGKILLAASHGGDTTGNMWLLGLEQQKLHNSLSFNVQRASVGFRQLGQAEGTLPTKLQMAANWTYYTERAGSFGLGYARLEQYDSTRISTISGNYSTRVGERNSLNFTASRAIGDASGTSIGAFFVMPLDKNRLASATANSHGGEHDFYVSAIQNPSYEDNLGWRTLAGHQQNQNRAEGGLYYTGSHGRLSGDASYTPDQTALRVGANGGVVLADSKLFATERVDQSFAVAEVAGYGDVGIGLGGNMLTRTDANGVALIPRLMPYQNNPIRLAADDLPVSAEIDTIELNAVPAWRSAVKVVFPVRGGRGALLKIVFDDGDVAPAGAIVQIEGDKEEFYVARRGEAFVTGLQPSDHLLLNWNGQQCEFEVSLPPNNPDEVPRLGPLLCKGVTR